MFNILKPGYCNLSFLYCHWLSDYPRLVELAGSERETCAVSWTTEATQTPNGIYIGMTEYGRYSFAMWWTVWEMFWSFPPFIWPAGLFKTFLIVWPLECLGLLALGEFSFQISAILLPVSRHVKTTHPNTSLTISVRCLWCSSSHCGFTLLGNSSVIISAWCAIFRNALGKRPNPPT